MPLLGAGLLSAAVGGVLFASVALNLDDRRPVLALARTLPAGQAISASDLKVVRLGVDGDLAVVPAGEQGAVVGRVTAVALPAGSLLTPAALGGPVTLGAYEVAVGVSLEAGSYPPGLRAGDRVSAVGTDDERLGAGAIELATGVVESVDRTPGAPGSVVRLRLARHGAAPVINAAAARRLALALLPPD